MHPLNLHPVLDVYILMVLSRGFLEPEGKLFFAWTLTYWEKATDPAIGLPIAMRIPGWKRYAAFQAAALLILFRAGALLAVDLTTGTTSELPLWLGSCQFQLNPLPTHLHLLAFSFLSCLATGLLLVGCIALIHHSVSLDYRETPTGLLLAELFRGWSRHPPILRLVEWAGLFWVFTCVLLWLSGRWIAPLGTIPTPWSAPGHAAVITISTLAAMLTPLQCLLCIAMIPVLFPLPRNVFIDAVESLSEALCAPLRSLDLTWKGLDWTYLVALITLTLFKTGLAPLLRGPEQWAKLPILG